MWPSIPVLRPKLRSGYNIAGLEVSVRIRDDGKPVECRVNIVYREDR